MASEDRRKVLIERSASSFRDTAETLVHRITASSVDRFFYAAASYLEDQFDDFSAGPSLRRAVDDLLGMLELTEDCDQVRVRNTLSPDKECWHDAWETLREKALIDSPRILTTHEVSSLLEAFDDHHHGKVHGSAIETVIRAVETFGVEKVAKRLEGLEEECNKKDSL